MLLKHIQMLDLRLEYEYMKDSIDSAIKNCLEHQKWILGPEVRELENRVSQYIGVKNSIGVSSGTDALVLSLRALAIKLKGQEYFNREDEIITSPFTFTATGDAILRAGATPVFIDIDIDTYNIDIQKIKDYLKTSASSRVVGIIPVHLYGQACDMDEIMEIANNHNLFVVEDVAQAFGGAWKGTKLGSIGTCGAFSFFPSKNLGAYGDAGMVTTDDDEIAEIVRMLLKHGGKDKYNVEHIGYNSRIDTLQAAILLSKIKYIDEFNEKRRQIAEIYSMELSDIKGISLPVSNSQSMNNLQHVFHQYTIRTQKRDELRVFLREKGVSTSIYYPFPLHKMKVFDGKMKTSGDMIKAEQAAREVLSLPIGPLQGREVTMYVASCIKEFFLN